jgi:RNA methyltransferase, TrmH family
MITSPQNPKIQQVRSLLGRRRDREEAHAFVIEGVRLVEEALHSHQKPSLVLFTDQLSERGKALVTSLDKTGCEIEQVPAHLMESISGTEAPQGLLAVLPFPVIPTPTEPDFLLVLDGLRDPGNLGTILRTAAAAGVQKVILTPGSVDPYAPKVVRSGMGAHFRLPITVQDWMDIRKSLKYPQSLVRFYLAEAESGQAPWNLDLKSPLALVIGGEAEGAGQEARSVVDGFISIPMPGKFESLNAAVAASILLFEVVRQRNL